MNVPFSPSFQKSVPYLSGGLKKGIQEYLFEAPEMTTVWCDGGNLEYGHPRVYLACRKDETISCPYCSKALKGEASLPFTTPNAPTP